jgi:hypothetical protein
LALEVSEQAPHHLSCDHIKVGLKLLHGTLFFDDAADIVISDGISVQLRDQEVRVHCQKCVLHIGVDLLLEEPLLDVVQNVWLVYYVVVHEVRSGEVNWCRVPMKNGVFIGFGCVSIFKHADDCIFLDLFDHCFDVLLVFVYPDRLMGSYPVLLPFHD